MDKPCKNYLKRFVRGTTSLALFALFGAGALVLSPVMMVVRDRHRCQRIVRASWRFILWLFVRTGLIGIELRNWGDPKGAVIVANHPSLIDVVILVAMIPKTLYVAKSALLRNPFLMAIVRKTALPDDSRLMDMAKAHLAEGWNVLIFPEGTRTPLDGGVKTLRRGAAQLAIRTGSPLVAVRMDVSRRILAKNQKPWDMGEHRVGYSLTMADIALSSTESINRSIAIDVTTRIKSFIFQGHKDSEMCANVVYDSFNANNSRKD